MIKKRNTSGKERIEAGDVKSTSASFLNNAEFGSYKDEAIMVLNLLESQKINIYDPENTPGMYLKRKNQVESVPRVFKQKESEPEPNQIRLENLRNFFKNNKNNG